MSVDLTDEVLDSAVEGHLTKELVQAMVNELRELREKVERQQNDIDVVMVLREQYDRRVGHLLGELRAARAVVEAARGMFAPGLVQSDDLCTAYEEMRSRNRVTLDAIAAYDAVRTGKDGEE
jgi:hypothetical protein